ncbi:hypothetical protein GCM10027589_00680 [Actinocorallia lasiicapitis]
MHDAVARDTGSIDGPPGATGEAEEFVRFFSQGFAMGDGEGFLEHFIPRLHPDHQGIKQPLASMAYGPAGFRRVFKPLFEVVPDLHGEVHRWGATSDGVLIEFTLTGTLGRSTFTLDVVDRFVLDGGLIRGVHTYYDPLPLLPVLLAHPLRVLRLLPRLIGRERRP